MKKETDVVRMKTFGGTSWNAEDVLRCEGAADWTIAQAEEWLMAEDTHIRDRMVQAGWGYIQEILGPLIDDE